MRISKMVLVIALIFVFMITNMIYYEDEAEAVIPVVAVLSQTAIELVASTLVAAGLGYISNKNIEAVARHIGQQNNEFAEWIRNQQFEERSVQDLIDRSFGGRDPYPSGTKKAIFVPGGKLSLMKTILASMGASLACNFLVDLASKDYWKNDVNTVRVDDFYDSIKIVINNNTYTFSSSEKLIDEVRFVPYNANYDRITVRRGNNSDSIALYGPAYICGTAHVLHFRTSDNQTYYLPLGGSLSEVISVKYNSNGYDVYKNDVYFTHVVFPKVEGYKVYVWGGQHECDVKKTWENPVYADVEYNAEVVKNVPNAVVNSEKDAVVLIPNDLNDLKYVDNSVVAVEDIDFGDIMISVGDITCNSAKINFSAQGGNQEVEYINIYLDDVKIDQLNPEESEYTMEGLSEGKTYKVSVEYVSNKGSKKESIYFKTSIGSLPGGELKSGLDLSPLIELKNLVTYKFPFSLPWDVKRLIENMNVEPKLNDIEVQLYNVSQTVSFPDFVEEYSVWVRKILFMMFVVSILYKTPELLGGAK